VKEQLAIAETEEEKVLLNGRQAALKLASNSVYGFTGAQVG
jgi:DNA polymerase elongation subunit (family B)